MSAILESVALFDERVQMFGLSGEANAFTGLGWTSFGQFAFAVGMGPGVTDMAMIETDLIIPLLGPRPTGTPPTEHDAAIEVDAEALRKWLAKRTAVKRLYWEAGAHAAADLERRVQARPEDDQKPLVMPATERKARLDIVKAELEPGLRIVGPLLPSDKCVDTYDDMRVKGKLKYMPWSKTTRRDQEMLDIVDDPFFQLNKDGTLKWMTNTVSEPADISDMLKVQEMLNRRGVALQMGKLCTFVVHQQLVAWYFELMASLPPPYHKKVSLWQIMRCDEAIWIRMQEQTMGGLPIGVDGSLPLSKILLATMDEKRIGQFVTHLQGTDAPVSKAPMVEEPHTERRRPNQGNNNNQPNNRNNNNQPSGTKTKKKNKNNNNQPNNNNRNNNNQPNNNANKGKGNKGKGNKNKDGQGSLPRDAIGKGWKSTINGVRICYGYNLPGGCPHPTNQMLDCKKGRHWCAICGGNHVAGGTGCTGA